MSERAPQAEIDAEFARMTSMLGSGVLAQEPVSGENLVELADHYHHLKNQGYTDEEIEDIFDLTLTEGGVDEI